MLQDGWRLERFLGEYAAALLAMLLYIIELIKLRSDIADIQDESSRTAARKSGGTGPEPIAVRGGGGGNRPARLRRTTNAEAGTGLGEAPDNPAASAVRDSASQRMHALI
jgi:hypothetical protein